MVPDNDADDGSVNHALEFDTESIGHPVEQRTLMQIRLSILPRCLSTMMLITEGLIYQTPGIISMMLTLPRSYIA
jgi:hypothetical protein